MNLYCSLLRAGCAVACLAVALGASAADFSYAEAAKPYKGKSIRVLDEVTPLQEALSKIVPDFEKETGIKVDWELLNHFEVINKGQADMLSGRGYYDAVMLHGFQLGPLLTANVIRPIDDLIANKALANPGLDRRRLHPAAVQDARLPQGQAIRLPQLELQPGLLGPRRPSGAPRRAGRLQGEVRLRPRSGQDARADARHRRVLHAQEGREARRRHPRERFLRHRARGDQGRLDLPVALEQLHQELWRRHHRRRGKADLRPAGERCRRSSSGPISGNSRRPAWPSIRSSTCRP